MPVTGQSLSRPMTTLKPHRLRCDRLAAPQGLATRTPRFGWALKGGSAGAAQTAYEIVVSADPASLTNGEATHWASGKQLSDQTQFVPYAGQPLVSGETLHWSVRVWDENDVVSDWAAPQSFMTGLFDPEDWQADWIARYFVLPAGREIPADNLYDNPWQARPADHLRRDFQTRERPVRATVYVTALGLYELYINGLRIGDEVMAPGWTDYHQRTIYQSFDVTEEIREGANAIGALIGEGWYSGRVGHNQRRAGNHYGGRPAFLCQLHLHYADGSIERIVTDGEWKTRQGPVCYSDFLMGEHYDARLEIEGWSKPDHDDSGWQPVEVFTPEPHPPLLTPSKSPPAREVYELPGRVTGQAPSGEWIVDFRQNFAGYCRLDIKGAKPGDRFTLRHGETLDEDGDLYTANLRHAVAVDHYTAKGDAHGESFKPRFTFHGFRYVALTLPEGMDPETVRLNGIVLMSDLEETGHIETGSELVNQLVSNIEWSQRGNFLSVPTDCPQRDERLGWSADAQVFWRTAGYNMDVSGFFAKWLDDIIDAQLADGAFTDIAPSRPLNPYRQTAQPGAPGWGDGPVIMVWQHYLRYGDRGLLESAYPALKRWMAHIANANPGHLRVNAVYNNYGDWLSVGPASDRTMVGTAYWVFVADLMAKIATVLEEGEDATLYADQATDVRAAFLDAFVDKDTRITGDTQTAYLLALDFKILPADRRAAARAYLIEKLDEAVGHLQTGFLGVKHLLPVLSDNGEPGRAYDLLLKDTYPSWGFSIRHGATTIWERWDGWTPEHGFQSANMNSFNHYAYGSVGEWLYARMAGIDWEEADPGFRTIRMRPLFDPRIGWVKAQYDAPVGRIESAWQHAGHSVEWSITVPPGSKADIELPYARGAISLDGEPLTNIQPGERMTRFTANAGPHRVVIRTDKDIPA